MEVMNRTKSEKIGFVLHFFILRTAPIGAVFCPRFPRFPPISPVFPPFSPEIPPIFPERNFVYVGYRLKKAVCDG
jgi:hypothetical protein